MEGLGNCLVNFLRKLKSTNALILTLKLLHPFQQLNQKYHRSYRNEWCCCRGSQSIRREARYSNRWWWGYRKTTAAETLTLYDGASYHIETSPSICFENQWAGFFMIEISVMKELKKLDKVKNSIEINGSDHLHVIFNELIENVEQMKLKN